MWWAIPYHKAHGDHKFKLATCIWRQLARDKYRMYAGWSWDSLGKPVNELYLIVAN